MPSSTTAQSLLSLPAKVTDPGPYAVFGLRPGESDSAVIAQAMKATIARLNAAKGNADPAAWQQAAAWVKRARGILLDPALKSQVDQGVRPTNAESAAKTAAAEPAAIPAPRGMDATAAVSNHAAVEDPLAGLLPGVGTKAANQLRPAAPVFRAGPAHSAASSRSSAVSPATGSAGIASTQPPPPTTSAETFASPMPLPIQVAKSDAGPVRRRRRGLPWTTIFLSLLTVGCVGGMAGIIYLLSQRPAGVVISLQPREADTRGGDPIAAAALTEQNQRQEQPVDPIMGRLGQKRVGAANRDPDKLAAADNWLASLPASEDSALNSAPSPAAATMPSAAAPPQNRDMTEPQLPSAPGETAADAAAGPEADGVSASAARSDAAESAIAKAQEAILKAAWAEMVGLAEAAERAAVTQEQKAQAAQLYQLADLASYYHGGIEKGLDGLGAGESFHVTEQLQIVVVEIGKEKVIFRFSGRNKEYPRNELPLVLAHKIARFAVPEEAPTSVAAAHAYQAIAPVSTPEYRQQAIKALESMTDEVPGAEPADVAAAIRDVFGE